MPCSELASPRATKDVLRRFGLGAKHWLGQNFLIDDNVIARILALAGLDAGDADQRADEAFAPEGHDAFEEGAAPAVPTVLEIGPGIGTLSVALLKHVNVIAIERDSALVPALEETTRPYAGRFSLIEADALKVQPAAIDAARAELSAPEPRMLVANLPYNIAATVVLDWLGRLPQLETLVVMVQSEVAERMCAQPGTKLYGAYSVKLALHARITGRFEVPARCFMPAPHVESAVVRLERHALCEDDALTSCACELADAAFAQRRKTIRNSMTSRYDKRIVDTLLATCGIDAGVRGETLSPVAYLSMARAYKLLLP